MAKIEVFEYEGKAASNPYAETIAQLARDTERNAKAALRIVFTADEYKTEKALIQKAANEAGFTAKEAETTAKLDEKRNVVGTGDITSVFVLRDKITGRGRKPKPAADAAEAPADAPAEAAKPAPKSGK